jgi:hypothetical protein
VSSPELTPVETDVVGSESLRKGGDVEEFGVEGRNFHPHLAGGLVEVEREESLLLFHAACLVVDRGELGAGGNRAETPEEKRTPDGQAQQGTHRASGGEQNSEQ